MRAKNQNLMLRNSSNGELLIKMQLPLRGALTSCRKDKVERRLKKDEI